MKILFASITDSGVLRVRSELIGRLLEQHHEVIVVTPQETDYEKLVDLGCRFVPVRISQHGVNPFSDLSTYRQYVRILKAEKPDIVLLFTTKPNIYCGIACRKIGIPAVMNITGMGSALGRKSALQFAMVQLYRLACNGKNMKCVFFQNDDSMDFFTRNRIGNPGIYRRIPGSGINLEKFPLQPFPDSSTTVDFLFVARVMEQKGINQYIEAARRIRETHPNAVFHVLGSCDEAYRDILREETQKRTIVYHGRVNNIPDYQRLSQCTIQPSFYPEGMSNVILEAAASGRPVITTDHPGCREGVDNGETGFIVPVKDVGALVGAIERILAMSREERIVMGLRARDKMTREFDRTIVTNAYLDVISS